MGLRLVDYDPNDYKLGEVLAHKHGHVSEAPSLISNILSMYFQWISYSRCFLYTDQQGTKRTVTLEYDSEERELTQIFINTGTTEVKQLEAAFIRLEMFENCYEFESDILESFEESGTYFLIVTPPKKITTIKGRKFPRIATPGLTLQVQTEFTTANYRCLDISLRSLRLEGKIESEGICKINLRGHVLDARHVPHSATESLLFPIIENPTEYGALFEIYCAFKYPSLRLRDELPHEEGIALFDRAGYAGKFDTPQGKEIFYDGLKILWSKLASGRHLGTIDYYTVNGTTPTGSSSLAHAFNKGPKEMWAFHQLCVEKRPDLIELSGHLYNWRAEYLAGKKEQLDAVFWYAGSSRWLERIYTKFHMNAPQESHLAPASFIAIQAKPQNPLNLSIRQSPIGGEVRYYYEDNDIMAAIGPDKLNANRVLNVVAWLSSEDPDLKKMITVAEALAHASGAETQVRLSFPFNSEHGLEGSDLPGTRFCLITKDGMIDFISCIEHSIAITKKKLELKHENSA